MKRQMGMGVATAIAIGVLGAALAAPALAADDGQAQARSDGARTPGVAPGAKKAELTRLALGNAVLEAPVPNGWRVMPDAAGLRAKYYSPDSKTVLSVHLAKVVGQSWGPLSERAREFVKQHYPEAALTREESWTSAQMSGRAVDFDRTAHIGAASVPTTTKLAITVLDGVLVQVLFTAPSAEFPRSVSVCEQFLKGLRRGTKMDSPAAGTGPASGVASQSH